MKRSTFNNIRQLFAADDVSVQNCYKLNMKLCEFWICCFNILDLDLSVYDISAGSSLIVHIKLERNNPNDRYTDI